MTKFKGPVLEVLSAEWLDAKRDEEAAKDRRLKAEGKVILEIGKQLPNSGTVYIAGGVKIVTSVESKWDQVTLAKIAARWKEKLAFPFRTEYKADGDAVRYMREHEPKIYDKLAPALTLDPKKPTFSVDPNGVDRRGFESPGIQSPHVKITR